MVAVAIAPDISRFSRSTGHSIAAAILSYGIGVLLVLMLSGVPALVTGSNDLISNISDSGLGIVVLGILVLATWTTNATNLYSASLGMSQWFVRLRDWQVTLVAGIVGTALALAGILDHFISFLVFLSLAIPPVAGIYISHYFLCNGRDFMTAKQSQWRPAAFIAWFSGIAVAATLSYGYEISFTSVPACDATLVAALVYVIAFRLSDAASLGTISNNSPG